MEDLVVALQEPAGDAGVAECIDPMPGRPLRRDVLDQRDQLAPVLVAEVVLREARVVHQLPQAEHLAAGLPGRSRVGPQREEAVGGAQRLVGRGRLVRGAERLGNLAGGEVPAGFPHGQRDPRLEQADVDELAAAGALASAQGGQGRNRPVERAGQVGNRNAHFDGILPAFLSGDGHEAAHPLRHDVQPRALSVRSVLSPPGGRDVDEAGVQLRQARVVELQVLHGARS